METAIETPERTAVSGRITDLVSRITGLVNRINRLEQLLNGEAVERARQDAKEMHKLYRTQLTRISVATEVAFVARTSGPRAGLDKTLSAAAIRAFDLPDAWWNEKENYPLRAWINIFADIAANGLPDLDETQSGLVNRLGIYTDIAGAHNESKADMEEFSAISAHERKRRISERREATEKRIKKILANQGELP